MRLFVFNKKTSACRSHGVMLLDIEHIWNTVLHSLLQLLQQRIVPAALVLTTELVCFH